MNDLTFLVDYGILMDKVGLKKEKIMSNLPSTAEYKKAALRLHEAQSRYYQEAGGNNLENLTSEISGRYKAVVAETQPIIVSLYNGNLEIADPENWRNKVSIYNRIRYGMGTEMEVNWSAHGSVSPQAAARYARLIAIAAELAGDAEFMNSILE